MSDMLREKIIVFAQQSARASAAIEGRVIPADYRRSDRVERVLNGKPAYQTS